MTKYADNPILEPGTSGSWDDDGVSMPRVLFDGTTYKMWFAGWDGSQCHIGYATSTDGIKWAKYKGNPLIDPGTSGSWDDGGIGVRSGKWKNILTRR